MELSEKILKDELSLKPAQRTQLIDRLLFSLDRPDSTIDRLWAKEAENRIDAYDHGELSSLSLEEVMERYK